jgi:predicted tellurium resistance membrane protein TerC
MATPLFIVLIVIETTDLVFALDSLPAVLAITRDGFIALTSNIFAILGLRSLYFALNGIMQLFRYLKIGLALILSFIGVKMLIEHWVDISIAVSLGVIAGVLTSVLASILIPYCPVGSLRRRSDSRTNRRPPSNERERNRCRQSSTRSRRTYRASLLLGAHSGRARGRGRHSPQMR